jgi:hypothetical protein
VPIPSENNPGRTTTRTQANVFLSLETACEPIEAPASRAGVRKPASTWPTAAANRRATHLHRHAASHRTGTQRHRHASAIRLSRVVFVVSLIALAAALAALRVNQPATEPPPAGAVQVPMLRNRTPADAGCVRWSRLDGKEDAAWTHHATPAAQPPPQVRPHRRHRHTPRRRRRPRTGSPPRRDRPSAHLLYRSPTAGERALPLPVPAGAPPEFM